MAKYTYKGVNIASFISGANSTSNTYFIGFPAGTTTNYNDEITSVPNYTYTSNAINYMNTQKNKANFSEYTNSVNAVAIPNWANKIKVILVGGGGGGGGGGQGAFGPVSYAGGDPQYAYNCGGGGGGGGAGALNVSTININTPGTTFNLSIGPGAFGGSAGTAGYLFVNAYPEGGASAGGNGLTANIPTIFNIQGIAYNAIGGGGGGGGQGAPSLINGSGGNAGNAGTNSNSGAVGERAVPTGPPNPQGNYTYDNDYNTEAKGGSGGTINNNTIINYSPVNTSYGSGGIGGNGGFVNKSNTNAVPANAGTSGKNGYARIYYFPS